MSVSVCSISVTRDLSSASVTGRVGGKGGTYLEHDFVPHPLTQTELVLFKESERDGEADICTSSLIEGSKDELAIGQGLGRGGRGMCLVLIANDK